jgi:hypothetical protein
MEARDFYLNVAHALSACQLVEQELKLYITNAFALAAKCIDDQMTFKFSGEDYEDSSLEGLIKVFRKLCSNDQLVKDLQAFKDERNFLSHKGITYCLDYDGELAEREAELVRPRLEAIERGAVVLCEALHEEANKFLGHLYFENEMLLDAVRIAVKVLRESAETRKGPSGADLEVRTSQQHAAAADVIAQWIEKRPAS